jgi:hypothetical protein
MIAAPKFPPHVKVASWAFLVRRTRRSWGEADVLREVTGMSTGGARRGTDPSAHTQVVEITSGRTVYQQGLAATCKDSPVEAEAIVGERYSVPRMSQYERRRWGNARRSGPETAACGVTPQRRKGALGKWRASFGDIVQTPSWINGDKRQRSRAGGITADGRGVCERALEPRCPREGPSGIAAAANRTRENRLSGMRGGLMET